MAQFLDRDFFGYQVCLRPDDWLRKRLVVPKLHFVALFPYFSGSDIYFSLRIKPNKEIRGRPPTTIKYTWYLSKRGDKEHCNSDSGVAEVADKKYKTRLFLGSFSFTDEYKLDLEVTRDNEPQSDNVANFEVTSRANFDLKLLWLLIGAVITIIGGVIGYFIGK